MKSVEFCSYESLIWLRYVLSPQSLVPQISDWRAIYEFADKQRIVGVCDPTKHEVKIDIEISSQWIGAVLQIASGNALLNTRTVELCRVLEKAGLRCCILKGQGNAEMYPNALSRNPGDIDVWIDADEDAIQEFVRERFPDAKENFKHIKFPVYDDVEVDVHQTPLKFRHPLHQRRLQKWINLHKEEQFANKVKLTGTDSFIYVPTTKFNAVYQLGHIMIHVLDEGIGFRQLIDYFYVLKKLSDISSEERDEIVQTWKRLGMLRIASAVMCIESEVLGLSEHYLLIAPNQRLGKMLLADILEGGNFGYYSKRQSYRNKGKSLSRRSSSLFRLLRLLPCFPGEAAFRIVSRCIAVAKIDLRRFLA